MAAKTMNNIEAIKTYFEADGGRKVTMTELKELTAADRAELGKLCAEKLGAEIVSPIK